MSLVVAGNGGNIFSNGLSGDLEISNSGMSPFPLRVNHLPCSSDLFGMRMT